MSIQPEPDRLAVMIIGCGAMGQAMATTLAAAGFEVFAHDIEPESLAALDESIVGLSRLEDTPEHVRLFVLSLPGPAVLTQVLDPAKGLPAFCGGPSLFVDTSTSDPDTTRQIAVSLQAAGHALIDAPVSGGRAGALAGKLTFYIGGDAADIARANALWDALAGKRVHVGAVSTGHAAKLANNFLCAGNLLMLREAAQLAAQQGIDLSALTDAVNGGSGRSAVSEINLPRWVLTDCYDSGFSMGLMEKDLRLFSELAESHDLNLSLGATLYEAWRTAGETLGATSDFNRVVTLSTDSEPE